MQTPHVYDGDIKELIRKYPTKITSEDVTNEHDYEALEA